MLARERFRFKEGRRKEVRTAEANEGSPGPVLDAEARGNAHPGLSQMRPDGRPPALPPIRLRVAPR